MAARLWGISYCVILYALYSTVSEAAPTHQALSVVYHRVGSSAPGSGGGSGLGSGSVLVVAGEDAPTAALDTYHRVSLGSVTSVSGPSGRRTGSSAAPTSSSSDEPTAAPSSIPTSTPSSIPSGEPSRQPTITGQTAEPSTPTSTSSSEPTTATSSEPTTATSSEPTTATSSEPTTATSSEPTTATSSEPTTATSSEPTTAPTGTPTTGTPTTGTPTDQLQPPVKTYTTEISTPLETFDETTTDGRAARDALLVAFAIVVKLPKDNVFIESITGIRRAGTVVVFGTIQLSSLSDAEVTAIMEDVSNAGFGVLFQTAAAQNGVIVVAPSVTIVKINGEDVRGSCKDGLFEMSGFCVTALYMTLIVVGFVMILICGIAIIWKYCCKGASQPDLGVGPTFTELATITSDKENESPSAVDQPDSPMNEMPMDEVWDEIAPGVESYDDIMLIENAESDDIVVIEKGGDLKGHDPI